MAQCPICGSVAELIYTVTAQRSLQSLAALYRDPSATNIALPDYRMLRCTTCELEFADPLLPGSAAFYDWVVAHPEYYPAERWEWGVVRERVVAMAAERAAVLTLVDVGCGAGAFLETLRDIPNVRAIGLDITPTSVTACRQKGLEAYCVDLEHSREFISSPIDIITAFHALEHVADPLVLVCDARDTMASGGVLVISTPYSPMSCEEDWFDPLNHPPHHLTRWTAKSYQVLARRAGMEITLIPGPVLDVLRRTAQAFALKIGIPLNAPRGPGIGPLLRAAIRHPLTLAKQFLRQIRRRRLNGQCAPDVIMVELTQAERCASAD